MSRNILLSPFVLFFLRTSVAFGSTSNPLLLQHSGEEVSQIKVFLSSLISQGAPHNCKLIFVSNSDEVQRNSSQSVDINDFDIMQEISSNYFHFVYSNESFNLKSYPAANRYPPLLTNHFRHSGQCFIVIITVISGLNRKFLKNTKEFLSPVYIPLVRQNECYFLFITKPHLIEKLLLSHEYPRKIKFKLALAYSTHNKSLQIKAHCFFCNHRTYYDSSSNSIVTFENITNSSRFRNYYFPDFTRDLNGHLLNVSVPLIPSRLEFNVSVSVNNAVRGICKYLFDDFLRVRLN